MNKILFIVWMLLWPLSVELCNYIAAARRSKLEGAAAPVAIAYALNELVNVVIYFFIAWELWKL